MADRDYYQRAWNLAMRRKKPKVTHVTGRLVRALAARRAQQGGCSAAELKNDFDEIKEEIKNDMHGAIIKSKRKRDASIEQ